MSRKPGLETAAAQTAAAIVRGCLDGTPADEALRRALGRTRFRSEPARRRDVSRAVFAYFRWLRWLEPRESDVRRIVAAVELQERHDANPAAVKAEALQALAVPDWTAAELAPEVQAVPWLRQIQRTPPLWIRARDAAAAGTELGGCRPPVVQNPRLPVAAGALRCQGTADLFTTAAFREGRIEIQDLASQYVGLACHPAPGETWWDACAGEGGKTLHLSALMDNRGVLWASDRSLRRLARLKERAARAGVFNYRVAPWDGSTRLPTRTRFNGVLVDAPCSGLGTWQRNPHARWTTKPADVRELAGVQSRLLDAAAPAVRPGGRLVYSVCTLTRAETTAVTAGFGARHPEFVPAGVFEEHAAASSEAFLLPQELDANGMFIAAWKRI